MKPLNRKTIERIERLSGQQIAELKPKHMKDLTRHFDERCARLIMAKGQSTADQQTLLDAMRNCFNNLYTNYDSFGNEFLEEPMPSWFEEWDSALAFGELIQVDQQTLQLIQQELKQEVSIPVQQSMSIPVLLEEEGMLKDWMTMSMNRLSASLNEAISSANGITGQIKSMRDGSITRLLKRIEKTGEEL